MSWSESNLHRWLASRPRPAVLSGSQGHDAAVLKVGALGRGERSVLCCDQTIAGVHFDRHAAPAAIGHKAAARALSDLAATASTPVALMLALRAEADTQERWLRAVIDAVARTAAAFGAELLGGDLACAPGPCALSVTALGRFSGTGKPPGRDRARVGDLVLLTGPVGGSRAGRHLRIEPRLEAGRYLFDRGARVLMDVSDGLALDLSRIATASGKRIELTSIPIHRDAVRAARSATNVPGGRSARDHALQDGEDHELIATLSPADWKRCGTEAQTRYRGLSVIGSVKRGSGLFLPDELTGELVPWDGAGGFVHAAKGAPRA